MQVKPRNTLKVLQSKTPLRNATVAETSFQTLTMNTSLYVLSSPNILPVEPYTLTRTRKPNHLTTPSTKSRFQFPILRHYVLSILRPPSVPITDYPP